MKNEKLNDESLWSYNQRGLNRQGLVQGGPDHDSCLMTANGICFSDQLVLLKEGKQMAEDRPMYLLLLLLCVCVCIKLFKAKLDSY